MALNIDPGSNANITPYVKYDARVGAMFRIDRMAVSGNWQMIPENITDKFRATIDLENIEVGWMNFAPGQPPNMNLVKPDEDKGPQPTENHKQGFRVLMKLDAGCAGGEKSVREFASNSIATVTGVDMLHNEYLKGLHNNPGLLPVVKLGKPLAKQTKAPNGSTTTNYIPQFVIESWTGRPDDLQYKPRENPPPRQQAAGNGGGDRNPNSFG